jgi:hypothetical protein
LLIVPFPKVPTIFHRRGLPAIEKATAVSNPGDQPPQVDALALIRRTRKEMSVQDPTMKMLTIQQGPRLIGARES